MVCQTILMIYENYRHNVRRAAAQDARHLGALSRILTGKRSDIEELLPDFDAKVEAELERLSREQPDSTAIRELAQWMLEQFEAQQNEPQIRYAFMAVQRHLIPLIGFLSDSDAACLAEKFETAFPYRERFPSHTELIKKLKVQSCNRNKQSL